MLVPVGWLGVVVALLLLLGRGHKLGKQESLEQAQCCMRDRYWGFFKKKIVSLLTLWPAKPTVFNRSAIKILQIILLFFYQQRCIKIFISFYNFFSFDLLNTYSREEGGDHHGGYCGHGGTRDHTRHRHRPARPCYSSSCGSWGSFRIKSQIFTSFTSNNSTTRGTTSYHCLRKNFFFS